MKKVILSSLLFIYITFSFSQTSIIDTCGPSFKDIYNFEVGDVFQYFQPHYGENQSGFISSDITTKYTIIDKTIVGDTFNYKIKGIKYTDNYCSCSLSKKDKTSSVIINENLIYIDSSNHFLNKCKNELIIVKGPQQNKVFEDRLTYAFGEIDSLFSTVQLNENNKAEKIIGDYENIFFDNKKDSSLPVFMTYKAVYAKNTGLIEEKIISFEYGNKLNLQGYIKNGDTTGTVSSDRLLLSIAPINNNLQSQIIIFPNPSKGIIHVLFTNELSNPLIYSVSNNQGLQLQSNNLTSNDIDLSNLDKGVYFLTINDENNYSTTKIVLE